MFSLISLLKTVFSAIILLCVLLVITHINTANSNSRLQQLYNQELEEYETYKKAYNSQDNFFGSNLAVLKTQRGVFLYDKRYPPDFILPLNPKPLRDTPPIKPF